MMPAYVPRATYRVQLTKDFTFDDAAKLAPYLKDLGISHLYASPFLTARPGSTHGYDIVDHNKLNPELGGDAGFLRMSDALREAGLGLILDFVPNHMGVGAADNAWWLDMLEWGQKSPHAATFDIDWDALPHWRHPGVLLPILGKPYGDVLKAGEIELKYDGETGSFSAWYFQHKLPINPQRYGEIVKTVVAAANANGETAGHELIALTNKYRDPRMPSYRDAPELKRTLAAIAGGAAVIERGLSAYRTDTEAGTALLHRLLERQHYRVAYWRIAYSSINYRRFFDINDLAGIRPEHPETFRAIHALVARLVAEGRLQGIRLDHIDGLRDPAQYARRLRQLIRKTSPSGPLHVTVEKILGEDEQMPHFDGVAGTTGYEWLNVISRVLVDGAGLPKLDATWRAFTGEHAGFSEIFDTAKRRVVETMLASEFTVLTRLLARIAAGHYSTRDYTIDRLRAALQLYVLEFPVYRTYITAAGISERDRAIIDAVIARARARWQGPDPDVFDFLRKAMTLDLASDPHYSAPRVRNFALKLQQLTGPLMAKSLEDTTFYRVHKLLALNEVGGEPDAQALTLEQFHSRMQDRAKIAPHSLTATATHDTKRGEDARARILVLSEIPGEWQSAVEGWGRDNARLVTTVDGLRTPSLAHEYMLYQALIGAWPLSGPDASFVERMQAYALKAAREGKQQTSWTNPNEAYEAGLEDFIGNLLDPAQSSGFVQSFGTFAARTARIGALNGLSQLVLKAMMPGVPDFYQGTEFWDFSLVDPDNRRPVDFAARRTALADPVDWAALAENWQDGRIKLALTHLLLSVRRDFAPLLRDGAYTPVQVAGASREHVIAFSRSKEREEVVIAAGRHFALLDAGGGGWPRDWRGNLETPPGAAYQNLLAPGSRIESLDLAQLFGTLPVTVLQRI